MQKSKEYYSHHLMRNMTFGQRNVLFPIAAQMWAERRRESSGLSRFYFWFAMTVILYCFGIFIASAGISKTTIAQTLLIAFLIVFNLIHAMKERSKDQV